MIGERLTPLPAGALVAPGEVGRRRLMWQAGAGCGLLSLPTLLSFAMHASAAALVLVGLTGADDAVSLSGGGASGLSVELVSLPAAQPSSAASSSSSDTAASEEAPPQQQATLTESEPPPAPQQLAGPEAHAMPVTPAPVSSASPPAELPSPAARPSPPSGDIEPVATRLAPPSTKPETVRPPEQAKPPVQAKTPPRTRVAKIETAKIESARLTPVKREPVARRAAPRAAESRPQAVAPSPPSSAASAADHAPNADTAPSPSGDADQMASAAATAGVPATERPGGSIGQALPARYRSAPPPPPYPRRALAQSQQGVVLVRALIDPDGRVRELRLWSSSGFPLLDKAAISAVAGWPFAPALVGGRAVTAWVEVPVQFRIN